MADFAPPLRAALAAAQVVVGPDELALVQLPRPLAPRVAPVVSALPGFWSLTLDDLELTLVLPTADWQKLAPSWPEATVARPYRLLTFDLPLPLDLVGFLAAVSAALAAKGLSIYALSAFTRDHLLVRAEDLPAAAAVLAALRASAGGSP